MTTATFFSAVGPKERIEQVLAFIALMNSNLDDEADEITFETMTCEQVEANTRAVVNAIGYGGTE